MTSSHSAEKTPPLLSTSDRCAILDKVLAALDKRFYKPEKLNDEWRAAVNRHRDGLGELPPLWGANLVDTAVRWRVDT